jgi:hypothetical protein
MIYVIDIETHPLRKNPVGIIKEGDAFPPCFFCGLAIKYKKSMLKRSKGMLVSRRKVLLYFN